MGYFRYKNESFNCLNCGSLVPLAKRTCRNHCPFCLVSRHVDEFPGDRSHSCEGLMDAFAYESQRKKGVVLWFRCRSCDEVRSNIALLDDPVPDDYDKILKLIGKAPTKPSKRS